MILLICSPVGSVLPHDIVNLFGGCPGTILLICSGGCPPDDIVNLFGRASPDHFGSLAITWPSHGIVNLFGFLLAGGYC